MTGDEIQEVDLGLFHQNPFVDSVLHRKKGDQKILFRDRSFPENSKFQKRRSSSVLLDKLLRRGSYTLSHGEDNPGFALKKGSSVSSSLYSSSSSGYISESQGSRTSSRTTWFIDQPNEKVADGNPELEATAVEAVDNSSQSSSSEPIEEVEEKEKEMQVMHLTEDQAANYFSFFNINNDGYITKRQLKRSMELLGFDLTDDEVDIMIETADTDSDGLVSFDDFKSLPFISFLPTLPVC